MWSLLPTVVGLVCLGLALIGFASSRLADDSDGH